MSSPFPGMDPYLESRLLWHDVHQRLAGQISRQLMPYLVPRYVARLATRFVTSPLEDNGGEISILYPDVDITPARSFSPVPSAEAAIVIQPAPLVLPAAAPEQLKLVTVELRDVSEGRLVTAIELLSPVNKRPGPGLTDYRAKRETVLSAQAHLLEIDLLRRGTRPPQLKGLPACDYCVFLTRAEHPRRTEVWPIDLRDLLPVVPVPLLLGDKEAPLDLGHALRSIYDEARYDLSIDYQQPPDPPLTSEDTFWAEALLAAE